MVNRLRKYQSGEGARYITRKSALRKLQLTLRDFRTLCIIKGIYPREPKHRRRAQQGKTGIQTLYLKKDIQFLMHEPIIWKIREKKVHLKRIKRARSMKDYSMAKRYASTIPIIDVDHIIKERYPTFIDALRDLDDCLTICFMFAALPRKKMIPSYLIAMCRRLTLEFMHVVIASRALRHVFVSIKGVYYQVEFRGQIITWLVSHSFGFDPRDASEVDFRTMTTFVEFYSTMLGFVNFRLYHSMNLCYPPQLQGYTVEELENELIDDRVSLSDRIAALNIPLKNSGVSGDIAADEIELDQFLMSDDAEVAEQARQKYEELKNLKNLFNGMRVFLNREVPREMMVFVLRCCGAEVSWDTTIFPGQCLFNEDDETITHQIVDRPSIDKQYISRYYVQPQWVLDSLNARKLLPVEKYFIGVPLPPHLSPFSHEHRTHRYVPPEEKALKDDSYVLKEDIPIDENELLDEDESANVDDMINEESDHEVPVDTDENEKVHNMEVKKGETYKANRSKERKDFKQMHQLKEKMIRRKYRNLYKSMMQGRRGREKEIKLLKYKRRLHERKRLEERKAALKAQHIAALM